jgi:pimeloyl-ACP methyl ester carboxylesterase
MKCLQCFLSLLLLGAWSLNAEAQRKNAQDVVLIYKDGFSIRGQISEKTNVIYDAASGRAFPIFTGNFYLDDHVRRILFSRDQVQRVTKLEPRPVMTVDRLTVWGKNHKLQPGMVLTGFTDWDEKGERKALFTDTIMRGLDQKVARLTPNYIMAITPDYDWTMMYFTSEFGPELTRAIVQKTYQQNAKLKTKPANEKLLEIAKFMQEAGWYAEAEKELKLCFNEYPADRKTTQKALDDLKRIRLGLFVDSIEQAARVGQHQTAIEKLDIYEREGFGKLVAEDQRLKAQDLKNTYDKAKNDIALVKAHLKRLPASTRNAAAWKNATDFIADELSQDTVGRLDKFLDFAQQLDNDIKQNRKPNQTPEQVLAMAVSGWLQGNQAAEPDADAALKLARVRQLVLECLKSDDAANRFQLSSTIKNEIEDVDVIARLVRMIPPSHAEDPKKLGDSMTLKIEAPGGTGSYMLQLPPGYNPMRSYPVLILLQSPRDKTDEMIKRFTPEAAKHGFILAAPQWTGAGLKKGKYQYRAEEHAIVIDTLRDLRRRFAVDSDRVFLFGWEDGANMAFDVGLGHPDLFAGVIPMNATLPTFTRRFYWPNAQYLPFYIVEGERNVGNTKVLRELFKQWTRDPFAVTYVEYIGRSSEWYTAEIPIMMDWMNPRTSPKKRFHPTKELGRYRNGSILEDFHSSRSCDNRFYWLSSAEIDDKKQIDHTATTWPNFFEPASFQAQITLGNQVDAKTKDAKIWNQIDLRVGGLRQVTIWLTPGMMDYSKDLKIRVNTREIGGLRKVQPRVETLLEELYQTGDRQRLFVGRIDIKL